MKRILEPAVLTKLRTIGDAGLDQLPSAKRTVDELRRRTDLLPQSVVPDPDKLFLAQCLYRDYTAEISGALLLAALPQSYATEYGAGVLGAHGQLTSNLTQRIGRTAQFLVTVLQQGENTADDQNRLWDWRCSKPGTDVTDLPWARCVQLRLFHQNVRKTLVSSTDKAVKALLGDENKAPKTPLNQEDLLGMLLMFSFVVFEVLDRFGICWTADEQDAFLHLWDVVGGYLAIGSDAVRKELKPTYEIPAGWQGLRPPTIDDSRCLVNQIRTRQWIDPTPQANVSGISWTSLRAGRELTRALLDELQAGMPSLLKPVPIAVMRSLNPEVVRNRLNLGSNGVLMQSLSLMPKRRARVAPFTSIEYPNKLAGRVLRSLANDVTARASVHLGQKFELRIAGAPDWEYGAASAEVDEGINVIPVSEVQLDTTQSTQARSSPRRAPRVASTERRASPPARRRGAAPRSP